MCAFLPVGQVIVPLCQRDNKLLLKKRFFLYHSTLLLFHTYYAVFSKKKHDIK